MGNLLYNRKILRQNLKKNDLPISILKREVFFSKIQVKRFLAIRFDLFCQLVLSESLAQSDGDLSDWCCELLQNVFKFTSNNLKRILLTESFK